MSKKVSVIIPTMNEAKYLPRLLESLKRQTIKNFEIIIADSESNDKTIKIAKATGARISYGKRKGPGEGRNRGAKKANGDVFVFVDADCILPPNLLEFIVNALKESKIIGGCTSFVPNSGSLTDKILFKLANLYQGTLTSLGLPHNAGYCFFFRKEVFEKLGGLREDLLLNETHDIALRSRSLGKFVFLPITVKTSLRRFQKYGYVRTILREYVASTLYYYLTGKSPSNLFKPKPAR